MPMSATSQLKVARSTSWCRWETTCTSKTNRILLTKTWIPWCQFSTVPIFRIYTFTRSAETTIARSWIPTLKWTSPKGIPHGRCQTSTTHVSLTSAMARSLVPSSSTLAWQYAQTILMLIIQEVSCCKRSLSHLRCRSLSLDYSTALTPLLSKRVMRCISG